MKELPLVNPDGTPSKKVVQIDDAYYPYFVDYTWIVSHNNCVYRVEPRGRFNQRQKKFIMARVILGVTGSQMHHHIDRNRLNNRQNNLEIHTLETLMKLLQSGH